MKKLIVDANILGLFFQDKEFTPAYKAIKEKRWMIAYGGTKQLGEYKKAITFLSLSVELGRSGRAIIEDSEEVDKQMTTVVKICKSNDPHIIALAKVSGARLLCSHDEALGSDFTNVKLIKPRGKVYKDASHAHLLNYKVKATKSSKIIYN